LKIILWGPTPLGIFLFNTQTIHIKSTIHNSIAMFSLKTLPDTLAGFEPCSSVHDADAMSTAPSRKGNSSETLL
jgi:hypothetical protein